MGTLETPTEGGCGDERGHSGRDPWCCMNHLLGSIAALSVAASAGAFENQHPPFAPGSHPRTCRSQTLSTTTPPVGISRHVVGKLTLEVVLDEDYAMTARLLDAAGSELVPTKSIAGAPIAFHAIEAVELTGDAQPDIVITLGSAGNGLAGGYAWRTLLLSNAAAYRAVQVTTYDPSNLDFILVRGACALLQLAPLHIDQTRDGKGHYFWVYNLLRFDGSVTRDANDQMAAFRKWILYTYQPSHRVTTLLSEAQKAAAWASRDWTKTVDPY